MYGWKLIVIVLMIVCNGVLASYEIALASVSLGRLKVLVDRKVRGANAALRMKTKMEASLSVIQIGITLVGAVAAATGGVGAKEKISPFLVRSWFLSEALADFLSLIIVVIPLSAVIITLGELIPKMFGLRNKEWVCLKLSPGMQVLLLIFYPAVYIFESIMKGTNRFISRIWRPRLSRDVIGSGIPPQIQELRALVSLSRAARIIGVQEEKIIVGASRLSTMRAQDIMVPPSDVVMLVADTPLEDNLVIAHMEAHTRFPVTEQKGDPQAIIGYVNFKEIAFIAKTHPDNPSIRHILRPLISIDEDHSVSQLLERMVSEHHHMVLVKDEDENEVVGLITLEDIIEELVGGIEDEFDRLPTYILSSGESWVLGGGVLLGKLEQETGIDFNTCELEEKATLSSYLIKTLGRLPKGGDIVQFNGVSFLIRKVRRHKVLEALMKKVELEKPIRNS